MERNLKETVNREKGKNRREIKREERDKLRQEKT
jgi:hypothetical protein